MKKRQARKIVKNCGSAIRRGRFYSKVQRRRALAVLGFREIWQWHTGIAISGRG